MPQLFTNNATSTLAADITNVAVSLTVASGHGSRFPSIVGASDYFLATLEKSDGTREIVRVTARSGDVFTVTRAQEGTTAAAFSTGDTVELRLTAGALTRYETSVADVRTRLTNSALVNFSTTNAWTAIPFDTEAFDTDGMHSLVTNTSRITINTPGTYLVTGNAYNETSTNNIVILGIRQNGSTFLSRNSVVPGGNGLAVDTSTIVALSAGDYLELCYFAVNATNAIANGMHFAATLISFPAGQSQLLGSMREITRVVTSGSQSSVTINNIPQGYRDLRVVISARSTIAGTGVALRTRFNGDTGNNYDWMRESRFGVASGFGQSGAESLAIVGATSPANGFTHATIDIPEYTRTDRHKMFTTRGPIRQASATGNVFDETGQGWWLSTNAINQITLAPTSDAFVDGSTITLYGVGGEPSIISGESASATVATDQSTSSTTYTDLATVGPAVSLVTGTEVIVTLSATMYRTGGTAFSGFMAVDVSGVSTVAASDANCVSCPSAGASFGISGSRTFRITGLTPGLNTFTAKYRCNGGAPWNFYNRDITVQAL